MHLPVYFAYAFLEQSLRAFELDHLKIRVQDRNIVIYSEEKGEEAGRAVISLFLGDRFLLCVANHRGRWQPVPCIGTPAEVWKTLTGKLAFALARWQ